MSNPSFIGMVSYRVDYSDVGRTGRVNPESVFPTYIRIIDKVGSDHHLVKLGDELHYSLRTNDGLASLKWYETEQAAREAFEKQKAEILSGK